MKDYKRFVLWTDYFNSTLSREQGRRMSLDKSVKDPTLDELSEAMKRLDYEPESVSAKYPGRMTILSGYVSVKKKGQTKKSQLLQEVTKVLSTVRGERSAHHAKDRPERR